jgi:SEC-C motif
MDRPQSPSELRTVFQRTVRRLDAGLAEMDAGDPLGVDLVAGALRQLTVPDRGDRLLERARDTFSVGQAQRVTSITLPAPKSEMGLSFALGSVPYDKEPPANASTVSTPTLLDSRCLLISDGDTQVSYRWVSLIAVIANKLGSVHSDAETPKAVDELSTYVIGGVPVLRYALRMVGATVAADAHAVLKGIDPTHRPLEHQLAPDGPWVGAVRIYGSLDRSLDIRVEGQLHPETPLVGWDSAGRIDWLFDPPEIGGVPQPDRSHTAQRRAGRNQPCPCQSGRKFKHCCGE